MPENPLPEGYREVIVHHKKEAEEPSSPEKKGSFPVPHTFALGDLYEGDLPLGLFSSISEGAHAVEQACYRTFANLAER